MSGMNDPAALAHKATLQHIQDELLELLDSVEWPQSAGRGLVRSERLTGFSMEPLQGSEETSKKKGKKEIQVKVALSLNADNTDAKQAEAVMDQALLLLRDHAAVREVRGFLEGTPTNPQRQSAAQSRTQFGMESGTQSKSGGLLVHPSGPARHDSKRKSGHSHAHTHHHTQASAQAGAQAGEPANPQQPPAKPIKKEGVETVKHIIAIASGKGGVGKSTISANLALALRDQGHRVGLLDADVYGPSQQQMLGGETPGEADSDGRIIPPTCYGVKLISMGFLVDKDRPVIWRGPMLQSALRQLLFDVSWGNLDVLLVDMPPGTGDVSLSLAQMVPLSGAVIVSTPQDIALLDAVKAIQMFRRLSVPVFGIIENMATFICPKCGEATDIFGRGGVEREAERLDVVLLGSIALSRSVREQSDIGKPIIEAQPEGPEAAAFRTLADHVAVCWTESET